MKKKLLLICIAVITFLVAIVIMLYPIISTMYNEQHQSEIHTNFREQVAQADNTEKETAKALAVAYNEAIANNIQLTESFSKDALLWASEDYKNQLNIAGNGIMGYVEIPSISVNLPIFHGTEDKTLEYGIGHLLGTSLPVGGSSTHTVLTGHSGMASQRMFSDLDQLSKGDVFYLEV